MEDELTNEAVYGLSGEQFIDYNGLAAARAALLDKPSVARFLTPAVFMRVTGGLHPTVGLQPFLRFCNSKVQMERLHLHLQEYDVEGLGYLRETDIENLVADMVPTFPGLRELQHDFVTFYVYTAVRKFMFFLPCKKTGRVGIKDILGSEILSEFLALRDAPQPESNWFGIESSTNAYSKYIDMDTEGDGLLSPAELLKYPSGFITPYAAERIFQECLTYEGLLDYKGYLDLVLALENKNSEASIRYFWKLLDISRMGKIGFKEARPFLESVLSTLKEAIPGNQTVVYQYRPQHLFSEIIDMLGLVGAEELRLSDLLHSPNGGTVARMLIDAHAFFLYDTRESQAQPKLSTYFSSAVLKYCTLMTGQHSYLVPVSAPTVYRYSPSIYWAF